MDVSIIANSTYPNHERKKQRQGVVPCDEKDLALLAIFRSGEIKVIDSISALVLRNRSGEIILLSIPRNRDPIDTNTEECVSLAHPNGSELTRHYRCCLD